MFHGSEKLVNGPGRAGDGKDGAGGIADDPDGPGFIVEATGLCQGAQC